MNCDSYMTKIVYLLARLPCAKKSPVLAQGPFEANDRAYLIEASALSAALAGIGI
jgi:hypothetical protein